MSGSSDQKIPEYSQKQIWKTSVPLVLPPKDRLPKASVLVKLQSSSTRDCSAVAREKVGPGSWISTAWN